MHSKSCCVLFLLVLVACQAAPSHKITEKSNNETEAKLAKEDLKLEDTGADKDRAKKSTTFCLQVHSGKEEIVPCNQEVKETPVKSPDLPKSLTITQPAPAPLVQYPVSNVVFQQPQAPQPSSNVFLHQTPQVIHQPIVANLPAQPQPSVSNTVPQQTPQHHVIHVEPQHFSVEPLSLTPLQQPSSASIPTSIINIVPAPASAPCETSKVGPQPPEIHTVHVVQPPQPAPQSPVIHHVVQPHQPEPKPLPQPLPQPAPQPPTFHEVKPMKMQEKPLPLLPHPQELSVPFAHLPCKSEVILAPPSPMELVYHEEEPKLVEYVPVSQESYECSCRSEQQSKVKPSKHHVTLYPRSGRMSLRSPMMAVQYNPSVMGSEDTSPMVFAAQTREMEGRHHKKKIPLHLTVQYPNSFNNPPKYESNSYLPSTYNSPYVFSSPYGTDSSYSATNYDSYSKENSYPYTIPMIAINAGGPFYRNSKNENSEELSADNKSIQETLSNVQNLSFSNQKRETTSTQLKNDIQKEITEKLPVEKESIKQINPKIEESLKQKEE